MNDANAVVRERAQDPVCGMEVDPATAAHRVEHDGTAYYFCGADCAETAESRGGSGIAGVEVADAALREGKGLPPPGAWRVAVRRWERLAEARKNAW